MSRTLHANHKNHIDTIVCDIDGVLADNTARYAALSRDNPDWTAFHADQENDPVLQPQAELLNMLYRNHRIVLLTNRSSIYREATKRWLSNNQIKFDLLLMREAGTDLYDHKTTVIEDLKMSGWAVRLIIDDDPIHCKNLVASGAPVMYIHSGYYDKPWDVKQFLSQEQECQNPGSV